MLCAPEFGDARGCAQQRLGGGIAQTHDNFGGYQLQLA